VRQRGYSRAKASSRRLSGLSACGVRPAQQAARERLRAALSAHRPHTNRQAPRRRRHVGARRGNLCRDARSRGSRSEQL